MKIPMRRPVILAILASLTAAAQEYRLRVTVDLVQMDATVTDAQGNPVSDLKASDFRLLLDGKPQALKHCNYVPLSETPEPPVTVPATAPATGQPAMPSRSIERKEVRRTIVLFVGDLLTSAESMTEIRAGLKEFVEEQVHPGDLVAIVRSSAGLGALQDFTPDKRMLLAAVDQVRWTPNAVGIGGASAYETIGQPSLAAGDMAQLEKIDSIERATLATTASLERLVRGMADLPGTKSVIVLSDALRLSGPDEKGVTGDAATGTGAFLGPIYQGMRRLVDASVRAGVVMYTVDTRTLSSLRAGANDRMKPPGADNPGGGSVARSDWTWDMTADRRAEYSDNQWGAMFLANQTGGFMITDSNRIDAALARVMADQRGYYLLGFQPPADALHPDSRGSINFHRVQIELLRRGLKVRSHSGFFGVSDAARTAAFPEMQLSKSIESPFQTSDINLEVETSYLSAKNDYFLRATLYIDGKDVAFEGPPIHRTGVLHVILRAFNATGGTLEGGIDQLRRIDLNEEGYQRAQKYGLIYTTLLQVSKPGPYQVRAACRDEATGKIGTGGEFVSIPKGKGSGLRLSGIVFQHALGTDDHVVPASGPSVYSAGQSARFAVQITSTGPKPRVERLQMHVRLFRDGVEVWKSAAMPVETDAKKTASLFAKGAVEIPKGLEPGRYMVRVDLSDTAQPDSVSAWQWAKLTLQ